jgi:hypothetical protein
MSVILVVYFLHEMGRMKGKTSVASCIPTRRASSWCVANVGVHGKAANEPMFWLYTPRAKIDKNMRGESV